VLLSFHTYLSLRKMSTFQYMKFTFPDDKTAPTDTKDPQSQSQTQEPKQGFFADIYRTETAGCRSTTKHDEVEVDMRSFRNADEDESSSTESSEARDNAGLKGQVPAPIGSVGTSAS